VANGGLIVFGDAPMRGGFESFAGRDGVGGRIRFSGCLDHFEMSGFPRQMHVLVLPTRTVERYKEQFTHVLIEAMSAGVASVECSLGEITRGVEEDGFVFSDNESAALVGILQVLLDRFSLLGRLSGSRRKRAVSEFGWYMISEKTHAIYGRILSGKNAGYGAEDE